MVTLNFRNQPAIDFAKSVRDVVSFENEYARIIMDRSRPITEELVSALVAQGTMGYAGRNPRPAIGADGSIRTTDLDLLSFLVPLAARQAVIEIPAYANRRQAVVREGERKIGGSQFGPITSLVSNKSVFSFSIKIFDRTIAVQSRDGKEELGAYRNYLVVDCDGNIYNGWDRIVWKPDADENSFLSGKDLWTGNSVRFKYFVHPNRWQSVFGAPHLLKKMLLVRLDDEARFYRGEVKRLRTLGIRFPKGKGAKKAAEAVARGATRKIKVATMEMILSLPEFSGAYQAVPETSEGLLEAYRRQKLLTYTWKPLVQFVVRANEAAFFRFGFKNETGRIARWLRSCSWVKARKNGNRGAWYQKMVLSDRAALLYRLKTKTETVAA